MIDPEYQGCYESGVKDAKAAQATGEDVDLNVHMESIEYELSKENPSQAWIAYDRGYLSVWD